MNEYVIMPTSDYQSACDAIRAVSGKTDLIKSGELSTEIADIIDSFTVNTEERIIPLAMADGDMVIEPSAVGKALSKVTVPKPETLIPENIAEGVDIAGIVGTLVAGKSAVIASGTLASSATTKTTVTHGLGVVPDIIIYWNKSAMSGYVYMIMGISDALGDVLGFSMNTYIAANSSGKIAMETAYNGFSITATNSPIPISHATAESFQIFGSSTFRLQSGANWIAIGGLT